MVGTISQFAGIYREWAPNASLREHVRCVWVNDLSKSQKEWLRVVPDGCADIVWTGSNLIVAGPDSQSILDRLPRGAVVVGIRFQPGAASSWLGVPLSEVVDCRVPLAEFWRGETNQLLGKVTGSRSTKDFAIALESFLLNRLTLVGPADKQIALLRGAAGENCLTARVRMNHLAAHIGMSERTLRRRCMVAFGYGFKTLERILRFQRFMRLAAQPSQGSLADLAARSGYADQAHMSRDVHRMSGVGASELAAHLQS